jgi:hypothetical protein
MNSARPTKGLPWTAGAIGTAEYRGALLRDVLVAAGFTDPHAHPELKHVQFTGLDADMQGAHCGNNVRFYAFDLVTCCGFCGLHGPARASGFRAHAVCGP